MNDDNNRTTSILVWDLPVRVFHWLMAGSFAGAWLTAESERWRLVHVTLGCTLAGLVAFRLLWGFVGTRHARFADFVRGPRAVARYLRSLVTGRAEHHVGHNPAGALAIVGLLALGAATTALGWAAYAELGGEWLGEAHEAAASVMLALVGLHVAGVVFSSWRHRENLVRGMFTGRKQGRPDEGIAGGRRPVAAVIVAAVLGLWWLQWQDAPVVASAGARHAGSGDRQAQAPVDGQARRHLSSDDD